MLPHLNPLPPDQGSREELLLADELAKRAPAQLSDRHISLIAAYDRGAAKDAYDARTKALKAAGPRESQGGLVRFAEDLAATTFAFVKKALAPRDERLTALEQRVQQLEQRPAVAYSGTYDATKAYHEGALVTRNGGLWLATMASTGETPGRSDAWRLVVKSGHAPRE
ncbi:MAG TPA: hypothetical protein VGD94_23555 [Vicinamibacterales bacterium]